MTIQPGTNPDRENEIGPQELANIRSFADILKSMFAGQNPETYINTAIQPRTKPDLDSLPTAENLISQLGAAQDFHRTRMPNVLFSSGEPGGEQPEWQDDWLSLHWVPGAEDGSKSVSWTVHKGQQHEGTTVKSEPYVHVQYFPAGLRPASEDPTAEQIPAKLEVTFFSRREGPADFSSVTRTYKTK